MTSDRFFRWVPPVFLALLLSALSIDGRSLWTDEIGTWELTQAPGWQAWAKAFWGHYNSDGQLPLYHLYMFGWVQLFGDSEWLLRAANLPWLILAFVALNELGRLFRAQTWMLGVAACSAFLVYYLNDARPYIMYLAGSSMLTLGMFRLGMSMAPKSLAEKQVTAVDQSLRECLLGSVVLIGGNILGVFWILSCLLACLLAKPRMLSALLRSMWRQRALTVLGVGLCLALIAVAVHSHLAGARASQNAAFSMGGLVYGLLELLGAVGIGPSRNDLRVNVRTADPTQLILMFGVALLAGLALLRAFLTAPSKSWRVPMIVGVAAPLVVMVLMGLTLHWRVVGRHLSAMLPLILLGLALFFRAALPGGSGQLWRIVAALLLLGLLASAVSMRVSARHMKDDYRLAAEWARVALGKGQTVLWIADQRALAYYRLTRERSARGLDVPAGLIPYTTYPSVSSRIPRPDVVLLSPREGVDPEGLARPVLLSGDYVLHDRAASFERYKKRDLKE